MKKIDRYITMSSDEECMREWEARIDPRFIIKKKAKDERFFQGRHVSMKIIMSTSESLCEKHAHGASKQVEE